MVRKWWAVLNRAVKECATPWKTASEASEAIKLALGIVHLTKTVGGQFMQYPKSLTELTDPELDDAVVQMLGVVQGVTGVDPEDWKKEIADIGEDETTEPASALSSSDDAAGSGEASPGSTAADPTQIEPPAGETIRATQDGAMESEPATVQSTVGSDSNQSEAAERDEAAWLKGFARSIVAAIAVDDKFVLATSKGSFVDGLSRDASERARAITKYAVQVARNEMERADALDIIAGKAGCEIGELAV
ncbi:MAG: hypothetical protein H0W39_00900 [Sphingomonas sp.]|nr:hypothetical protein [Sphingomonas sp.]